MLPPEAQDVDALIVGGGPAGLTCAIYLARYRRKVVVVDGMKSRAALIPETHNYPGFADGIAGPRLLDTLASQADLYGVTIIHDHVAALQPDGPEFTATCSQAEVRAKRTVLATGLIDKTVPMPDLEQAVERGLVRYCPICDGFEASDLRIGVLGNADDAAAKALFVRTYSRQVTLLQLDGRPCSQQHFRELSEAGVHLPAGPVRALARQEHQIIASMRDGTQEVCDVIYPVLGCDVRSELGKKLGASHNEAGCLEVDAHHQTSVVGYAIGDVYRTCIKLRWLQGTPPLRPRTFTMLYHATSAEIRALRPTACLNRIMACHHFIPGCTAFHRAERNSEPATATR